MKKYLKQLFTPCILISLAVIIFCSSVSYAWLTVPWGAAKVVITDKADFAITEYELWTNGSGEEHGWSSQGDIGDTELSKEKKIAAIGTFSGSGASEIFTLKNNMSLYFGEITNLVQAEDNAPVYMKFKFTLQPHTENRIAINYELPDNYVKTFHEVYNNNQLSRKAYTVLDNNGDAADLQSVEFIKFEYFTVYDTAGSGDGDFSLNTETDGYSVPTTVEEVFDKDNESPPYTKCAYTATADTHTIPNSTITTELNNDTDEVKNVYLYFKFYISADALKTILSDTDIKYHMPMVFVFNVDMSLDLKSIALED